MSRLRYAAIWSLDWLCGTILRHRWYRLCCWIGEHPWWQDEAAEMFAARRRRGEG